MANEKYKLLGFDVIKKKANVMILNTGRVMNVHYDEIIGSELMDDFNVREIEAICRKMYSSDRAVKTQYEFSDRNEKQWIVYSIFCLMISVCYVFSNISAVRPVALNVFSHELIITPGTLVYPFTFLIVDLLNEFYGFRLARLAIYMCVIANAIILFFLTISLHLPIMNGWVFNDAYNGFVDQLKSTFIASSAAFLFSELANSWVLCLIKKITNSKFLYIRILSSIFVASIIDSVFFCYLTFSGVMKNDQIMSMIVVQVIIKLIYALFNVLPAYGTRYLFNKYLVQASRS